MIFKRFNRSFIEASFNDLIDQLNIGLSRLSLVENTQSYLASGVVIAAGTEAEISHNLKVVPTMRIIVKQTGNANIIDGDMAWTSDKIYLKNPSGTSATVSVLIMR